MKDDISHAIFSFTGISILIGVVGVLSGFVTLFIDVNSSITVKWFLALSLIYLYTVAFLLKQNFDLRNTGDFRQAFETPIRYVPEGKIFLIRKNDNFVNNILVGCYVRRDEMDTLAYLGEVIIVQDKFIQIKVVMDFDVLSEIPNSYESLRSLMIRSVIPVDAVRRFTGADGRNG